MKTNFLKYKYEILGAMVGAIAGWCYWYFVGCSSGSCSITSKPLNSTVYGMLMGGLIGGLFKNSEKEKTKK